MVWPLVLVLLLFYVCSLSCALLKAVLIMPEQVTTYRLFQHNYLGILGIESYPENRIYVAMLYQSGT